MSGAIGQEQLKKLDNIVKGDKKIVKNLIIYLKITIK